MSTLRDADLSLANWLKRVLPPGTGVRFDAPRAEWERHGSGSGSTFVSVFLSTVRRDDKHLPLSGWLEARDQGGRLVGMQSPPRHYQLTYLITAWAGAAGNDDEMSRRALEEHELLGLLIEACAHTETIADDDLTGTLAEAGIPSLVRCVGEDAGHSAQGPWSGFGIAPRAHLELELVVPVVPAVMTELAAPAQEIVVGARQIPGSGPVDEAGASAGTPATRTGAAARRWERSTITEPTASGQPGRTPPGR